MAHGRAESGALATAFAGTKMAQWPLAGPRRSVSIYSIPCSRAFHIAAIRKRSLMAAWLARSLPRAAAA